MDAIARRYKNKRAREQVDHNVNGGREFILIAFMRE